MKFSLLGTGDAIGTPKIGCDCPQCVRARETGTAGCGHLSSSNMKDVTSLSTPPPTSGSSCSGAVPRISMQDLWTHGHYDHFMGFGEFYRVQKCPPVFATDPVLRYCGETFRFLDFKRNTVEPYVPFDLFGITVTPFLVKHPPAYTCGFVFEACGARVGYTSDTNRDIPQKSLGLLENLDLLLLDALVPSHMKITKHMNYLDACTLAESLHPNVFRCVHISHVMPWEYPHLGFDGEVFDFP